MEVACCGGLENAVKRALQASGKKFIPWQVVTISTDGHSGLKKLNFLPKGLQFVKQSAILICVANRRRNYARLAQLVEHLLDVQEVRRFESCTAHSKNPHRFTVGIFFRVQLRRVNASSPAIINARLQGAAGHF